jgi:hypothetical protein
MTEQPLDVDILKNVTLTIQAGNTPDFMDVVSEPLSYQFIFGLGVNGLSPFEAKLSHRKIGEEVTVGLDRKELHYSLHHHDFPFSFSIEGHDPLYMKIRVIDVSEADQREVIRGLANQTSCHDCDCGCGGH